MRIETEVKLDFKDVLIRPKRSTLKSRADVALEREFRFKHSQRTWRGVPIMVSNMDTTGTFEMCKALRPFGVLVCLHKHYEAAEIVAFVRENPGITFAVSAGVSQRDFDVVKAVHTAIGDGALGMICLDVANGYSEGFVDAVKRYRKEFPSQTLLAGNVVTGEMTEELILSGADVVKIGIGPGSVCTTRIQTGVGYPQLSAVIECADAAHGLGGMVISDGGVTNPGEFAKAFGGGADFVMAGGMFAGHDESAGEVVVREGKKFKLFYGMSSTTVSLFSLFLHNVGSGVLGSWEERGKVGWR